MLQDVKNLLPERGSVRRIICANTDMGISQAHVHKIGEEEKSILSIKRIVTSSVAMEKTHYAMNGKIFGSLSKMLERKKMVINSKELMLKIVFLKKMYIGASRNLSQTKTNIKNHGEKIIQIMNSVLRYTDTSILRLKITTACGMSKMVSAEFAINQKKPFLLAKEKQEGSLSIIAMLPKKLEDSFALLATQLSVHLVTAKNYLKELPPIYEVTPLRSI